MNDKSLPSLDVLIHDLLDSERILSMQREKRLFEDNGRPYNQSIKPRAQPNQSENDVKDEMKSLRKRKYEDSA